MYLQVDPECPHYPVQGRRKEFRFMGARCLESHLGSQLVGANYTLTPIFRENQWVQSELSKNGWVQLQPLTQTNDAPAVGQR